MLGEVGLVVADRLHWAGEREELKRPVGVAAGVTGMEW